MRQCHLSTLILAVRIAMNFDPGQNIIKDSKKKTAWMFPRMVVSLAWMLHWHLIWAIFSACDASSAWENACYASAAWGNACDDASSAWENACYASAAWGNACD